MKKTLLFALLAWLYLGVAGTAQAQCTSYAGGPYSDQGIDVAGCNGETVSAPYEAWLNEVYYTDVVAGGNYTFSFCTGYSPTDWGGEAVITAIINGTPSGAPPGTIDGGTLLGTATGCSYTFTAPEDGTVFFILSTATACGGAISQVDNGTPSVTTNSGVACPTECSTTPVFATFDAGGNPAISPSPAAFCEGFFTGVDAPVAYIAVAVFPGDGALYTFSNEDGFSFFGLTAEGFTPSTDFQPGFIGFMQITDELIAAAGATTTIQFNGATTGGVPCSASLTINWATDFPGISVADVCTGGGGTSTPGADICDDALLLNVANGAINGPFTNIAATGNETLLPPICFDDDIDPVTNENVFDNEVWFYFVGDGSTVTLTTSVAGAPSPMPNADTQMGVYIGSCTELIEIACNDDIDTAGENFLSSVTIETFPGETYYVVIDGFYYSSGPDAGDFFINVTTEGGGGGDCEANFGVVTPPAQTTICQDGVLGPFAIDGDNATAEYFSIFVVTTGANLTILGYIQEGSSTDFTGIPPGQYTYHAFNVAVADVETVDAAVAGGATGVDVANLIATGVICADLDVTGVTVTVLPSTDPACSGAVCEANYGEVVFGNTVVCEGATSDPVFTVGDNTLGYATILVITQGDDLTIVAGVEQGPIDFAGFAPGNYTVHAFNFDLDDLETITTAIESGAVTTGGQVAQLIADGVICAALDVTGVVFTVLPADDPACAGVVCEAAFGTVNFGSTTVCEGGVSDAVFVTGDNTDGYATVLVITQGEELTILAVVDQGPVSFEGLAPGSYTVHAFNFDLNDLETILTALESGAVTTGGEVAQLIADGVICADLDVAGVVFTVLSADDPLCTPPPVCEADFGTVNFGSTTVCEGGISDAIFVSGDNTDGYATALVITQGEELTILGVVEQGSIDFAGFAPGNYTVHAFNFDLADLETILAALETGAVTTGGEVAQLIADGVICADLDVAGVVITVLAADDPACAPFVCEANYGEVFFGDTTVCEGGISNEVFVAGDNTDGYTTLLVITQGEELTILNVVAQGSIDFAGYAPGNYTVHAFNFFNGDLETILAALETGAVTTGGEVAQLIADGVICADLDVAGVVFTVVPIADALCQEPPIVNSDFFIIAPNTESFDIPLFAYIFDVNGDELTVTIGDPDQGGTASYDSASGVLTFFPNAGFFGTVVIPFTVTDGFSEPVSGTMTIIIELSCSSLDPISLGVIEIVTNPVSGISSAYITLNGGLPSFDGSNYILNIFESPGVVLFSANNVPAGGVYTVPALSTTASTVTLSVTDGLGCSNDFVVPIVGVTLPVNLLNFTGTVETRGNLLAWTTASETNNAYYTLYRSTDGVTYQKIAQVEGKGTTSTVSAYNFLDVNAPNGLAYYQLEQTNFDGTAATLGTIVLRRQITALSVVEVVPVPASNNVTVSYSAAAASDVKVALFDLAGKLISEKTVSAQAGTNQLDLSVSDLAAGMYVLMLNNGAEVVTAKLVKE